MPWNGSHSGTSPAHGTAQHGTSPHGTSCTGSAARDQSIKGGGESACALESGRPRTSSRAGTSRPAGTVQYTTSDSARWSIIPAVLAFLRGVPVISSSTRVASFLIMEDSGAGGPKSLRDQGIQPWMGSLAEGRGGPRREGAGRDTRGRAETRGGGPRREGADRGTRGLGSLVRDGRAGPRQDDTGSDRVGPGRTGSGTRRGRDGDETGTRRGRDGDETGTRRDGTGRGRDEAGRVGIGSAG
jgi:hypothetical protein